MSRSTPELARWAGPPRPLTRYRRRRQVGRAYAMASEIAPHVPRGAAVLDVGCGDGYIAYHLKALRDAAVHGVDIGAGSAAPIPYRQFDGRTLPFERGAFDAALLCYVLHHAADPRALLREVTRVLRPGGTLVVYEDVPAAAIDRLLCLRHHLAWRQRGGATAFNDIPGWEEVFAGLSLEVIHRRRLSRLRDISYPIGRVTWVMRAHAEAPGQALGCAAG